MESGNDDEINSNTSTFQRFTDSSALKVCGNIINTRSSRIRFILKLPFMNKNQVTNDREKKSDYIPINLLGSSNQYITYFRTTQQRRYERT